VTGVSAKVQQALQDPEIRSALEQQAFAAEAARQQYAAAAQQLVQATESQLLASFPELKGVTAQTLGPVLHGIASRDPQRAQQIVAGIQGAAQNVQVARQHQYAEAVRQQQAQQQQFTAYAAQQDNEFEKFEQTRPAAEVKQVRENIYSVLKDEFGIDADAMQQLYHSNPAFRSAQAQKLIYAAVRQSLAEKAIHKAPANLPPVQRPGTAGDFAHIDDHGTGRAAAEFRADSNPRTAARLLQARRRAAALR
jgi:hypothetical protein